MFSFVYEKKIIIFVFILHMFCSICKSKSSTLFILLDTEILVYS